MSNQNKLPSRVDQTRTGNFSRVAFGSSRRVALQQVSESEDLPFSQVFRFLLLHVPLLLIFRAVPIIATFHSLLVLALGFHYLIRDEYSTRVIWIIAYIAGAEILWRGVEAAIFWEYGKYATLLLCILLILKFRLFTKSASWPWLFIALLVPGIMIMPRFDRQALAFQLSGLVTLGIAVLVFSTIEFNRKDLQQLFVMIIAPGIAMAFLMATTMATQNITFSAGSNEEITGGIGSNQVTSALSLGATAAFFYIFLAKNNRRMRNLMILLVLGLLSMSVLTFSRAGLWNTAGALLSATPFLIRNRRQKLRIMGLLAVLGLLGYFVILPLLNKFTDGAVLTRFNNFNSTGRDVIFEIDYRLFQANPVWGIGVGQSVRYHPLDGYGFIKETHTEYGRLLAEHGFFGILIIALLVGVPFFRVFSSRTSFSKAISTSFSVWALLYMITAATRMVAPSFAFGLAAARFLPEEEAEDEKKENEQTSSRPRYYRR